MAEETLARIRLPLPPVLHAREVSLVAERLCTCSQSTGRHALACPTLAAVRGGRLSDALEDHDRRVLAAFPGDCSSCRQPLDPDNLCVVNGIGYHLGNCPQPHGDTPRADPALSIRCPICDAAPGEPCDPPPGIHVGRREDHLHGKGSRT